MQINSISPTRLESLDLKERKVLLVYITKVSGHRSATMALQRTLRQLKPDITCPSVNGFEHTYPLLEKVVNHAYMGVIRTTPKVWDYLYDNPKVVKNSQSIKNFLHKSSHSKIEKLYKRHQPDTVVCTQAFPCGMFADYKIVNNLDYKLIGVLTDFAPHSFWINKGIDYYVVPSLEAQERFVSKGVPVDKIKILGIPIRSKFSERLKKEPIAKKLGLDLSIPIVLIMGGGQGLGPIKEVVRSLTEISIPVQMIVITGVNKKLMKWFGRITKRIKQKILYYEYANNVDEFMEIASLIVTKPGGLTTSEALVKGLPMVIVDPIPGQEMLNTDFLLKKGIGIRIDKSDDLGREIEILLKTPDRLAAMSHAASANAKPDAAVDIAKLILNGHHSESPQELVIPRTSL